MSSTDNHKNRSRRGHRKQRTILAPAHSPMIAQDLRKQRKLYRTSISQLFLGKRSG